MAGLVASGIVMVMYTVANWLLGRVAALRQRDYRPPAWWQVWVLCALPLVVGIPAITMTVNWPTLPPANAAACVMVTLVGLAFALAPGSLAARRPGDLAWLVFDGAGLMPVLLNLHVIEMPPRASVSTATAYAVAVGSILVGVIWLGIVTGLRVARRKRWPEASALFVSGLCLSYLLMPLAHHIFLTPTSYRYISASSNFFPHSVGVQLLVFFVAAMPAIGITRLRRALNRYQKPHIAGAGLP